MATSILQGCAYAMGTSSLFPLRDSYTKRNGKSEVRAFLGETLNEKGRTFNPTLPLLGLHCFATLVIGRLCSTPPSCGIQHGSSETQHFSTTGRPGNPPWHTALFGSQPNSRLVSVGDCRRARNVNGRHPNEAGANWRLPRGVATTTFDSALQPACGKIVSGIFVDR